MRPENDLVALVPFCDDWFDALTRRILKRKLMPTVLAFEKLMVELFADLCLKNNYCFGRKP